MRFHFDDRDRESVLRDLESPDEDVRRLAVERAAALPLSEAVPRLVDRLGDANWRVRKAAVDRLVACPDVSRAVEAFVGALADDENPGRRNAAVEGLIACGPRAVPLLCEAVRGEDPDVRKLVVDTLAGIGDPRATPPLLERLRDPDPNVRSAAAEALGSVAGDEAAGALLAVASCADEAQLVRFSALHALAAMERPMAARDLSCVLSDAVLRPAALALIGQPEDEEGIAELTKALVSDGRAGREAAMRSLLRIVSRSGAEEAEALAGRIRETVAATPGLAARASLRLEEADLATRLVLIQFLGLARAPESALPILGTCRDEALAQVSLATLESLDEVAEDAIDSAWGELDSEARRDACVLFGGLRGERSAARLCASLEESEPALRIAAAGSIGRRRLSAGFPLLLRRLQAAGADDDFESDEEIGALTEGLIALSGPGEGGDPAGAESAIALLTASVEGAAERVRIAIARVLGRAGRREDAGAVTLLLKDPSALVRRAAVDALARLDPGTAAEPLRLALADESASVRIAAAHALGASENAAVIDDLKRLADDQDPGVRAAAVRAVALRFGRCEDGGQRARALALVEGAFDDEAPVALAAATVLAEIGGPDAARAVAALGRPEPELLLEVARCLGAHGPADVLDRLIPLIAHPDWSVRAEAIQTLAERGVAKAVPPILRRLETEQDQFVRGTILRALERLEG